MSETNKYQKRQPKNPIKFKITLSDEQKEAKELILNNTITILKGKAGSGKTLLACQVALDLMFKNQIEKIVIIRPSVAKEDIGFLPGDLREKMEPWMAPIFSNLKDLYNKDKIDKLITEELIEIVPLMFMRGRTFVNACIIVDEAQNITHQQTEMVLSRIGVNSRMILCGDTRQIDLPNKRSSGFNFICNLEDKVNGLKVFELKQNHRNPIVDEILDIYYQEYENGNFNDGSTIN